jgi:hypothetical protein
VSKFYPLLLLFLAFSAPVWSQETSEEETTRPPTIIVDRPSFANGSAVVGDGVHSLETGLLFTDSKGDSVLLTQTPILYRVGVNEEFEFRLATNLLNYQDPNFGVGDLAPGFKWNFFNEDHLSVSLIGALSVPTGSKAFRAPGVVPAVSFAADVPLTDDTGILMNVGALSPGDGRDRVIQSFATFGVSTALTDKSNIYFEVAGFSPDAPGQPSTTAGDIVVTYLVNPDFQLDAAVFKGFSGTGLDWGFTLGMANRF